MDRRGHVGGGRGRGRGESEQQPNRQLRRPINSEDLITRGVAKMDPFSGYAEGEARPAPNADGWSSGENKNEIEGQTPSLSVAANEFIPKSTLNVAAREFVPRTIARNTSTWAYGQKRQEQQRRLKGSGPVDARAATSNVISSLTYSPGALDSSAASLAETLNANVFEASALVSVVDTIVETCIREANFRYTGARLCQYLSSLMPDQVEGKTFRDVLLTKCNDEYAKCASLMNSDVTRVRSFTLFLAELFLQFSRYIGNVQKRFNELGDSVLKLLKLLTSVRDKENLKSIAQTLKMAGAALDYEEKNKPEGDGNTPLMDSIMKSLVEISDDPSVVSHIAAMLRNLPELRKSNWGLEPGAQPPLPPPPPQPTNGPSGSQYRHQQQQSCIAEQYPDDSGVSYDTDGAELTAEEYEFINAQIEKAEPSSWNDPWDMPEDVEADYEEFLTSQK